MKKIVRFLLLSAVVVALGCAYLPWGKKPVEKPPQRAEVKVCAPEPLTVVVNGKTVYEGTAPPASEQAVIPASAPQEPKEEAKPVKPTEKKRKPAKERKEPPCESQLEIFREYLNF
jgi:outer membrane biosynthesis protein TonB